MRTALRCRWKVVVRRRIRPGIRVRAGAVRAHGGLQTSSVLPWWRWRRTERSIRPRHRVLHREGRLRDWHRRGSGQCGDGKGGRTVWGAGNVGVRGPVDLHGVWVGEVRRLVLVEPPNERPARATSLSLALSIL